MSHLQTVTTGNYVCQFRYGNGSPIKTTNSSLQARTGNSSNVIRCETPESFRLPAIPTGEGMNIVINVPFICNHFPTASNRAPDNFLKQGVADASLGA